MSDDNPVHDAAHDAAPSRPPVKDWATDWDHVDPRWTADPYPIWDDLRGRCPVARTDRFRGAYLPTTFADMRAIAYDTDHFSCQILKAVQHLPVFSFQRLVLA